MINVVSVRKNLSVYKNVMSRIAQSCVCAPVYVPMHACASVRAMLRSRSRVLRTWHTPTYPVRAKKVLVACASDGSKVYMDMHSGQSCVVRSAN